MGCTQGEICRSLSLLFVEFQGCSHGVSSGQGSPSETGAQLRLSAIGNRRGTAGAHGKGGESEGIALELQVCGTAADVLTRSSTGPGRGYTLRVTAG